MTNSYNYNSNGNGQSGLQGSQSMRTVRSTRKMISNVHALVGTILFGTGLFVFIFHFFFDHNAAVLSLQIVGATLALSGAIELTV